MAGPMHSIAWSEAANTSRQDNFASRCPAPMLIDFDVEITREGKDMLESTNPDAVIDRRRRGIDFSIDSDRRSILMR
jgi:hypothetical protein